ncbi:hypothetical protein ACWDGI_20425 [Streptomyces sp. NPDC001220]
MANLRLVPAASEYLDELVWWADTEWADHPCRPVEARPDEVNRQTRDYAKDLRHAALSAGVRDEMTHIDRDRVIGDRPGASPRWSLRTLIGRTEARPSETPKGQPGRKTLLNWPFLCLGEIRPTALAVYLVRS